MFISFPTPYSKLFYCKNSRSYAKIVQKVENDGEVGGYAAAGGGGEPVVGTLAEM